MAEKDEYGRPIEYPQTRESGSDSSLEEAIKGIDVVAIDARSYMSPLELLKHAATGSKPKRVGKLVGSAYNATSVEAAKEILRNVVTEADGGLYSLLCRQVYDRAIEAEQARLDAIEQQFKDTVLQVFSLADLDGSGVLEYTELRAIAQSDHEAEAILSHLDKDSNGAVSEDEWVDFFLALQKTNPALVQVLLERTVRMIFERDFMNVCRSLFHEFDQVCVCCASKYYHDGSRVTIQLVSSETRPGLTIEHSILSCLLSCTGRIGTA